MDWRYFGLGAGMAAAVFAAAPAMAATCEELAAHALPNGTIEAATLVAAGAFVNQTNNGPVPVTDLPEFCRVAATLAPTPQSAVRIEVWLPTGEAWNGKYVAVGNGGFAGTINANAMIDPLRKGYATSSTDTGHDVTNGSFGLEPEKLIDFAYRAVHEMAVTAKDLIGAYYETEPSRAYFTGCSTGGRQAITAALRYPADFDGIIAGAPAVNGARLHAAQTWEGRVGHRPPGAVPAAEQLTALNEAAIAACDMEDGVADRVLEDPRACAVPLDGLGLDAGVLHTVQSLYSGPLDAAGKPLFHGLAAGSETGWGQMLGPDPLFVAVDFFRYFVYGDENWSPAEFDPETAIGDAAKVAEIIGSESADLSDFFAEDGKLLLYHGWADPGITPFNTLAYHEAMLEASGPGAAEDARLFMVPGMGHCGGGEGPASFDMLSALDLWVEAGEAPARITASRIRDGAVTRTRPLCPFPQKAVYSGSGSTDEAASFICE